jgi:hypothetical protein
MTTIKGLGDKFDVLLNQKLKNALLNKIPQDLQEELYAGNGDIEVNYSDGSFVLKNCAEELEERIKAALKDRDQQA